MGVEQVATAILIGVIAGFVLGYLVGHGDGHKEGAADPALSAVPATPLAAADRADQAPLLQPVLAAEVSPAPAG